MLELSAYLYSGTVLLGFAFFFWLVSLLKNDVSIVDSLWSLMFLLSAAVYALVTESTGPRTTMVITLVALWAVRLSAYISWRNHGEEEDYRYQEVRRNNEPGFQYKSLYIVFGLQGLLAWIIGLPLVAAISGQLAIGWLDYAGIAVWATGMYFEGVGDYQLARFRKDPANRGKVLDSGLWGISRHPNYFGNFVIWWGFYLIALSAGAWWTIAGPLLMTVLLLKVSGVALLEKDISSRRPGYRDYVQTTNAFFPGPRRKTSRG